MIKDEMYKFVLNSVKDGVYFVDKKRQINFWNKSAEEISGFSSVEVVGQFCFDNILNHVDDNGTRLCHEGCPLQQTLEDGLERSSAIYLDHKEGHRVRTEVYIMPIIEDGEIIGAVETFNQKIHEDILKKHVEELKILAYQDQLTGLPNRRYLDQKIDLAVNEAEKYGHSFAVAMIDVDNFKSFNDTYGHDVGDEILKLITKVYDSAIRGDDFIGRWGGEEFIAIFRNVDETHLMMILERLRILVENSSLRTHEPHLKVTISIGATLFKHDDTIDSLIKRVDELMYTSKSNGRNRVTIDK